MIVSTWIWIGAVEAAVSNGNKEYKAVLQRNSLKKKVSLVVSELYLTLFIKASTI
jgi:hypothetical protein